MTSDRVRARRACRGARQSTALLAVATACLLAITAGCATQPGPEPQEYLDERTAATITVVARSIVLACDRPELGVNARDYVTLTGIDVNTSGKHSAYVLGYAWSTLDKRGIDDGATGYELVADDHIVPLQPMPGGFSPLGVSSPPIQAPSRTSLALAAPVSREVLRLLLESPDVRLLRARAGTVDRFTAWSVPDRQAR